MSADNNNADTSSNPQKTNQFEGISLAESSYIPKRSNNRAPLEDQPQGSQNELEENALSEVRGRDSQTEQRDMSVAQIQQDVARKLRMRPASDEFENKILQSSNLGETVEMLKKLVKDSDICGEAENGILEDLDNLKANLGASGIGLKELSSDHQSLIQKAFYETQIEIKRMEEEKLVDDDIELNDQLKAIEEGIESKNDDINEQKKASEREKNVLEANIARLKSELQSLQTFEVSLNNLLREVEDSKNKDANENNKIKSEIDNLRAEQQRIANLVKDARAQRRDAKDREYDVSQEIEELQEKLNSLKDLETKLEEIIKQFEKINATIQEGEKNIGELNKQCKDAKELYKQERQRFEKELDNQEIERKEKEKQKEEIERFVRENQGIEEERSPTSLAEEALRRQEERALFDKKIKNADEVSKDLNEKQERYSKWREDLESRNTESKRINELKEELKQNIEEAKLIEGAYLRLEKEYNSQKEGLDEVTVEFQLQRKEKLKDLNQKLEDAKNELAWGEKRRTGPFANFCVALVNTGVVGFLVIGLLYLSNITIPGFEPL